nr:MAG TPA: hypothetical protein [Caudoviricetes sp.]
MQLTPNYNLKKPEGTDPVDIQDFNDNADVVDAALKKKAESSGGDISEMTVKTLDNITTDFPVPVAGEKPKTFLGKVKKFFEDTKNWMTGVCLIGSIVNNCVTDNAKLPLSAAQGKALMDLYTVLNTNLAIKTITNCNNAKPDITNTALTYRIYDGLNMPISGINTFVVQPNGDSDTNFSQLAQCVYSTTKSNMGQLFTRRYVAETGWSSWEKVMSNADLNENSAFRMATGSVLAGSNYHQIRLQVEPSPQGTKSLAVYDNNANALIGYIYFDK